MQPRRFKQTPSLEQRLTEQAKHFLEEAQMLRPGPVRDDLIRGALQVETAPRERLSSPVLQRPR